MRITNKRQIFLAHVMHLSSPSCQDLMTVAPPRDEAVGRVATHIWNIKNGRTSVSPVLILQTSEQFGAAEFTVGIVATCSENVAVMEQDRTMVNAGVVQGARGCPGSRRRIIGRAT